jgi:hypothetical protein
MENIQNAQTTLQQQGLTKLLSLQLVMEHLETPFVAVGLQFSDSII